MISFGPIPSRRLGMSLGINNIISSKICSYSCIYCQVGHTLKKSIKREAFFQPEDIYENIGQHIKKLNTKDYPDYMTFVSNGEPTLDINLGKSVNLLKGFGIPIAVITNASLLGYESVRDDLLLADWVSLKMDAGDSYIWQSVNRPAIDLNFEEVINNIQLFANKYRGTLCTESMLVEGFNDSAENITNLSELIKKINPGKAYLSVPTRPPADKAVKPPNPENLNMAWQIFNSNQINTEFLTGFEGTNTGYTGNIYNDILNITAVHPLREDSLNELLQKDKADFQVVRSLINQRLIRSTMYNGKKYYVREYHLQF